MLYDCSYTVGINYGNRLILLFYSELHFWLQVCSNEIKCVCDRFWGGDDCSSRIKDDLFFDKDAINKGTLL